MTEREAFLKAVLADPSEVNRLVFDDWLEEHGEEELAGRFREPHPPGDGRGTADSVEWPGVIKA